jgi:hypothetical protein
MIWPWDGHHKSILLPADEEIMGSSTQPINTFVLSSSTTQPVFSAKAIDFLCIVVVLLLVVFLF